MELSVKKSRITYSLQLILDKFKEYNAKIIGEYGKLNAKTSVSFLCNCGSNTSKKCGNIIKYGATCDKCTKVLCNVRRKNTFREKYGVDCVLQNTDIKNKIKLTNLKKYGTVCALQNPEVIKKTKETLMNIYGVDNPNKSIEIINKTKQTNMERYGVSNPNKLEIIKNKTKQTNMERYGVECILELPDVKEKVKNICIEKYGVTNPLSCPEVIDKSKNTRKELYGSEYLFQTEYFKNKTKETLIMKYGVEHALQSSEIFEKQQKSAFSLKEYIMPSGSKVKIQGYEHYALDELLKKYNEEQIVIERKNVPRILYELNGKEHYYFPDIYIPHENKIIEVKSKWTFEHKKEITNAKEIYCKKAGYKFELWIFSKDGIRI